jgi:hypothetical protein
MPTSASDIYDLFMAQIKDYKLTALYQDSEEDFLTYMQGFLIPSLAEFSAYTTSDLTFDTVTGEIAGVLTNVEQNILAKMMHKFWLTKETHDIMQMNLHVQDRDFKVFAEANNLSAKENALVNLKEEVSQMVVDYGYKSNDWTSWFNGVFYPV